MSKNEEVGVFVTLCHVDRGSKSEIQPAVVFVPESADVRDSLLSLGAIREADEAEVALFEKLKVSTDDSEAADKAAADAAAAEKEVADKVAADAAAADAAAAEKEVADKVAAEAAAKPSATKSTATDKLVG